MGADASKVTEVVTGCLSVVVDEAVGLPPRAPQPQTTADDRPTTRAQAATIEQTGADPPPEAER